MGLQRELERRLKMEASLDLARARLLPRRIALSLFSKPFSESMNSSGTGRSRLGSCPHAEWESRQPSAQVPFGSFSPGMPPRLSSTVGEILGNPSPTVILTMLKNQHKFLVGRCFEIQVCSASVRADRFADIANRAPRPGRVEGQCAGAPGSQSIRPDTLALDGSAARRTIAGYVPPPRLSPLESRRHPHPMPDDTVAAASVAGGRRRPPWATVRGEISPLPGSPTLEARPKAVMPNRAAVVRRPRDLSSGKSTLRQPALPIFPLRLPQP